jgi:hypothetical protein
VNHHFLNCWRELDSIGSKNRGLLPLMRRHRHNLRPEQFARLSAYLSERPVLKLIYRFKQRLCYLLLKKHRTRKQRAQLTPRLLRAIYACARLGLRNSLLSDRLSPLGRRKSQRCGGSPETRNHRRFPHQNGAPATTSLRFPQLPKLSIAG